MAAFVTFANSKWKTPSEGTSSAEKVPKLGLSIEPELEDPPSENVRDII